MKILVLSLLRLGDIVLHRELVKSLKAQFPQPQVDMLIHSQFSAVASLLPEVESWHLCPRQQIQQILVEKKQSPLCAHSLLKNMIEKLNAEKYDLIVNATHNRFSVSLMDTLKAKQKRGVGFENGRKSADRNRWQTYLNEHFSETKGSRFHYLEVLMKSLGVEPLAKPETKMTAGDGMVLLQVLTSDPKKDWGLVKYKQLLERLKIEFPEKKIYAICSPFEKPEVLKHFAEAEVLAPLLRELPDLFAKTELLITGDTSIQHVAAGLGCPVLSLFLGSADAVKTGPWIQGATILTGSAVCSPCKHSTPCSQYSHLCGDSLGVAKVFTQTLSILRKESPMHYQQSSSTLRNEFEVTLWTHYLDAQPAELAPIPEQWRPAGQAWKREFVDLELCFKRLQNLVSQLSSSLLANGNSNFQSVLFQAQTIASDMQRNFPEMQDSFFLLYRALHEQTDSSFSQFKKIKNAWTEFELLTGLRKQLLGKIQADAQPMETMDV
jgi:ADP-heptose:LPS heptosyltransferase